MAFHGFTLRSAFFLLVLFLASCVAVCSSAYGQVAYPEQEARVYNLPSLTAPSMHSSDVLATSLEIIFHDHDKDVCCGKDSALEESVLKSDPKSLKDIAGKLQGRHLLSDGRPVLLTAEYLPPDAMNAGHLITMILDQHVPLMEWNSHLYIVCAVTYVRTEDNSTGSITYAIHKFLLQDVRFSDSRRNVTFDRLIDDAGNVQGLLFLQATRQ